MGWRYQGVSRLNPRLVTFLLASTAAGLTAAAATLIVGGGVLAALAANCLGGTLSLLALSVVAMGLDAREPAAAPQRAHA